MTNSRVVLRRTDLLPWGSQDVADWCGVTSATVRRWVDRGLLVGERQQLVGSPGGPAWRFSSEDFAGFCEARGEPVPPALPPRRGLSSPVPPGRQETRPPIDEQLEAEMAAVAHRVELTELVAKAARLETENAHLRSENRRLRSILVALIDTGSDEVS